MLARLIIFRSGCKVSALIMSLVREESMIYEIAELEIHSGQAAEFRENNRISNNVPIGCRLGFGRGTHRGVSKLRWLPAVAQIGWPFLRVASQSGACRLSILIWWV